jgi:hypothetical protein
MTPDEDDPVDLRARIGTLAERIADAMAALEVDWTQVDAWVEELASLTRDREA